MSAKQLGLCALLFGCAGGAQTAEPPELVDSDAARCTAPLEEDALEQCEAAIPMWAYSPSKNDCYSYTWGGCAASTPRNRFSTYEECTRQCVER